MTKTYDILTDASTQHLHTDEQKKKIHDISDLAAQRRSITAEKNAKAKQSHKTIGKLVTGTAVGVMVGTSPVTETVVKTAVAPIVEGTERLSDWMTGGEHEDPSKVIVPIQSQSPETGPTNPGN